jgi:hypothetical protein
MRPDKFPLPLRERARVRGLYKFLVPSPQSSPIGGCVAMRNHTNVILSRRRRIFLPLTKARSFGYRLRMTPRHSRSRERM